MVPPPPPNFVLDDEPRKPRRSSTPDVPPPPPGFSLDAVEEVGENVWKQAKRIVKQTIPTMGQPSVDGDTAPLLGGPNARLLGIDAPERRQQGYDASGNAVPVGEQSRDALSGFLAGGEATLGDAGYQSYGRPVAPVSVDGSDAGQAMVRQGQAYAAPDYLQDDPERLADYMGAERQARLNRQGVHGLAVQPPPDFRDAPLSARETVAVFGDMPTPDSGLSVEGEREWLALQESGTLEQMNAFATANGFTIDTDRTADWIRWRDETKAKGGSISPEVIYERGPEVLTDNGDGQFGAAGRATVDGFLASGLDEAGAFADSLGLTEGRENIWSSDRRWADVWENNRQQNRSILGFDESRYPGTTTTGYIAGSLATPWIGGKVTSVPRLAAWGGAYGGAEGFLGADGGLTERLTGAVIQAPIGAVAAGAVGAGGEALAPYAQRGIDNLRTNLRTDLGRVAGYLPSPDAFKRARNIVEGKPQGEGLDAPVQVPDGVPAPPEGFTLDQPISMAMRDETVPDSLSTPIRQRDYIDVNAPRPQRMDAPLPDPQRQAIAEGIEPRDVLPMPSNLVEGPGELAAREAGRFADVKPVNERDTLDKRTITNFMGQQVPKYGPLDLVGFLRSKGGLRDYGGELETMGITSNASRKLDMVGQEHRFGPIRNDRDGLSFDEAGEAAWEAGYFQERPDEREFLEALGDTYNGNRRRFLMEDEAEVSDFYGAKDERWAVEQEIAERGPLTADRSMPADDAPFAPPEAYEEWGPTAPDFAGNIRLDKLDTPQDIRRALDQSQRQVGGFDAATRGRVTQEETERLAAELNMTPEKLLARRKGQAFNAEEALAARQILAKSGNELVNFAKRVRSYDEPGDEMLAEFRTAWLRHVALQEQVSGATAEAGRALAQFRMSADSRAVRGDVLNAFVRGGGGPDRMTEAAQVLIDAAETSPGVFNAVAEKATNPKWRDKLSEFYINMLLSGPQTHAVNMASNALTALAQIPEYAAAAALGGVRRAAGRGDNNFVTTTEVGARVFGLVQGAREGARLFARALKSGEASDFASKVEGEQFKAIKGLKGEVIRVPTRLLTAEDELFKGIARRMELNGMAARIARSEGLKGEAARKRIAGLVADPTDDMLARALDYGRYLTFQRKLGPLAQSVSNITQNSLVAKVFMPFVRTPTNLLKFATERSPFAPIMREWRADVLAGGARRDLALSKALLGTGFATLFYEMALNGQITGSLPSDPKKARLLRADGWQPQSIKIGDQYYSYSRFDPFSTTLGFAADFATLPQGMSERQRDDKATIMVASILGNLSSKTWLSGVSDLVEAIHEPDRYAGNLLERLGGSFTVPAGVAQIARTSDPVMRQSDSVGEYIQSRIPGMSQDLLPRRNIWGEEITRGDNLGPDIVSPVWGSRERNDPVNRALLDIGYAPAMPSRKIGGEELTSEEYDRYVERSGKAAYSRLSALVGKPSWERLGPAAQEKLASKIVREARRDARAELFGGGKPAPSRKSGKADVPPPPPGFVTGDAGGVNVFADVQRLIPGVRITSGYRSPEYQAQMRARGYNPAANSRHLDGSALDLTPPLGRSMGWLAAEVRRQYPDAKVLNEGDHVHVEFAGYYGAPAIGNAAAAGLSNPNEGMAPPPPGFVIQ